MTVLCNILLWFFLLFLFVSDECFGFWVFVLQFPMGREHTGAANPVNRTGIRIVVAGDRGTGKSSLIVTAASENFPANVPPLLPPTRLAEDFYPDRVPITIIDTSSRCVFVSVHQAILWVQGTMGI